MPTTYAHDLFGKEVYKRLPSDMKALIRRHGDLYRIGLHGPDILFYYMVSKNPVTQFGIEMHHEKQEPFLKKGCGRSEEMMMRHFLHIFLGLAVIIFWTPHVILM